MTASTRALVVSAAVFSATPVSVIGHFKLIEPASWLIESERGDPQKTGPCGGSNTDWGKPSYAVTKVTGGQKLHLTVQETIYHPGHYRVALAVNSPTELPLDPETTTRDGERGSDFSVRENPGAAADTGHRRWPLCPRDASHRSDGAIRGRCPAAEHYVPEMHVAGRAVHGRARVQQSRRILISPLRRASDHSRPEEADRQGLASRAELEARLHPDGRRTTRRPRDPHLSLF